MRPEGWNLLRVRALCAALAVGTALVLVSTAEPVARAQQAAAYTIVDLGKLNTQETRAHAINARGQVVGTSYDFDPVWFRISGGYHALFWSDGTAASMTTIGPLPGHELSMAGGINNNGVVVGLSWTDPGTNGRAWRFENGVLTNLGSPGPNDSSASAINDLGDIVGTANFDGQWPHGALYANGQWRDLGTLPGGFYSHAYDINTAGDSVGYGDSDGEWMRDKPVLWRGGQIVRLPTPPTTDTAIAFALNDMGRVVGTMRGFQYTGVGQRALYWDNGVVHEFDSLGRDAQAFGVNNRGDAVGTWSSPRGGSSAALFTSSGQLIDLQLQIPSGTDWHLGQATGINDDGLIVGAGGRGSSGGHAFLLVPTGAQPVPVPTGTATPTSTASPTATSTATPTPTATASPTSTPTPTSTPSSSTLTVTFDDLAAPNRPLNGQYPNGAIDWGSNMWLLSGPWRQFTTNSVGFNGAQLSSATLTMLNGYRLVQFEAYNGGAGSSTLTLTCAGQSMLQRTLAADTRLTIQTGWTQSCSTITVSSTNGWDTNLDSLVLASNGANPIATNTPTPTPTPVPSAQEIVTFDALSNPGRPLNGLTGAIDWGVNAWYLSGPWGQFRTNSVGFNGPGRLSASFSLSSPRRVVQIDAFNGGRTSSTVSLSCAAQPSVTSVLAVGQLQTIRTAWSGTCTTVIVGSSNGWDTNFDTIVLEN